MLTRDGLKVLDFGLAKSASAKLTAAKGAQPLDVVANWPALLKKRASGQ